MWTDENRAFYDRSKLFATPAIWTDEEWALIEPAAPARQAWRRQADGGHAHVVNGLMYVAFHGLPVGAIPKDRRHAARCMVISTSGIGMALSIAFTMLCMCDAGRKAEREASPTAAIIEARA